jgi:hypothetical protein
LELISPFNNERDAIMKNDQAIQFQTLLGELAKAEAPLSQCGELVKFTLNPRFDPHFRRLHLVYKMEVFAPGAYLATYGASVASERRSPTAVTAMTGGEFDETWGATVFSGFVISQSQVASGRQFSGGAGVGAFVSFEGAYQLCLETIVFDYRT